MTPVRRTPGQPRQPWRGILLAVLVSMFLGPLCHHLATGWQPAASPVPVVTLERVLPMAALVPYLSEFQRQRRALNSVRTLVFTRAPGPLLVLLRTFPARTGSQPLMVAVDTRTWRRTRWQLGTVFWPQSYAPHCDRLVVYRPDELQVLEARTWRRLSAVPLPRRRPATDWSLESIADLAVTRSADRCYLVRSLLGDPFAPSLWTYSLLDGRGRQLAPGIARIVGLSSSGQRLAAFTAGWMNFLIMLDPATGSRRTIRQFGNPRNGVQNGTMLDQDQFLGIEGDRFLTRFALPDLQALESRRLDGAPGNLGPAVATDAERRIAVFTTHQGRVQVWNLDPLQVVAELPMRANPWLTPAISPDGSRLALATRAGVRIYRLEFPRR